MALTSPRSFIRRALAALLLSTVAGGVVLGGSSPAAAAGPGTTLYVRAGGSGDCATPARACGSVDAAFARATGGEIIELAAGSYGAQDVRSNRAGSANFAYPVVVRPAAGATVVTRAWRIAVHNLTLQGFTVRGSIQTDRPSAVRNLRIEGLLIERGTVLFNRVTGGAFIGNEMRNGMNQDALNIKDGSSGVLVQGNSFRDYRHDPTLPNADVHVDCIQLFSMSDVRVEGNVFDNCSQRAMILQVSAGDSRRVVVANNWFGGCDAADNVCQTANVPFQATGRPVSGSYVGSDYTIVNNRIDGYAFVESVPNLVFQNNTLGRYFHTTAGAEACFAAGVGYNLVSSIGRCPALAPNDRLGTAPAPVTSPTGGTVSMAASVSTGTSPLSFANPATATVTDMYGASRCSTPEVGPWEIAC